MMSRRNLLSLGIAVLAVAVAPAMATACPFCQAAAQTLLTEVDQAQLIVFGTMTNAKRDPNEFGKGTTDLKIEVVIKDNNYLKGRKVITLPRYVPPDLKNKSKHLVFCEIYKGELDPYRGEAVPPDSKIAEYLKGAIAVKNKGMTDKLLYFFHNFDSADWAISGDAFQEFSNAEYKDVRIAAAKMEPDYILKMLKDPNTSIARFGILGLLLGHCGKSDKHAKALRALIDDPKVKQATGLDGLLAGYILLNPKEGLAYVASLIKDTKEDFLIRYAALRSMRFFWDHREDVLKKPDIVATVKPLLDQSDIVDLVIEDLRKWGQWDLSPRVLALFNKSTHQIPIVQRSIIKFALAAPATNKECKAFIARMRRRKAGRARQGPGATARVGKAAAGPEETVTRAGSSIRVSPRKQLRYDPSSLAVREGARLNSRVVVVAILIAAPAVRACSYCNGANGSAKTFRQEAPTSKFVVIGTLANPRLVGDMGYTDLMIDHVIKSNPAIAKLKKITLPRWTPVDPKKPPRMLIFFDIYDGKFDPFRGVALRGTAAHDYLRRASNWTIAIASRRSCTISASSIAPTPKSPPTHTWNSPRRPTARLARRPQAGCRQGPQVARRPQNAGSTIGRVFLSARRLREEE